MPKIRVLLIEDNLLLREGILAMLNEQPDMRAVSAVRHGEAFEKVIGLKPHVILLDLGLRNQNSLITVEEIKRKFPETEVVVMDLIPVDPEIFDFVKVGVSGFILKTATLNDFLHTIRKVAQGEKVIPPILTDSLFSHIVEQAVQTGKVNQIVKATRMTRREQEIIDLIARGRSNKEISAELSLSIHTVKSHVHNILDKLALHTRLELASFSHASNMSQRNSTPNHRNRK